MSPRAARALPPAGSEWQPFRLGPERLRKEAASHTPPHPDGKPVPWRVALLTLSLILAAFALPPFLGTDSPLAPAGAVVEQGNATGCQAYGTNWTSCPNALLSDDTYAYANATGGQTTVQRVAKTTESGDASSWSFIHTVPSGSNRILLLAVATDAGQPVSGTPQYGGTSFSFLTTLVHSFGRPRVTLYALLAPAVGTALVTGNLASGDKYTVGAISYIGVHQTMPLDNLTMGQGSTGTNISIIVGSEVRDLVVDFTADLGNLVPIVGPGQTEIYNEEMGGNGTSGHRATSSEEEGASSVVMSRSNKADGKEWVSVGINLNLALPRTGHNSPSATGEDHNQWLNASDAFSSDDQYASSDRNGWRQDYYDFAFGVPNGATITGIEFQVEGHDPDSSGNGVIVELSWDGGTSYTSTGNFVDLPDGADAGYQTLGSQTDTWGRTWTSEELKDANFRARVEKDGTDLTRSNMDHLRIQVYYEPPVPSARDTAWQGFGFTLDPADEVQVVEVGVEWWRNNTAPLLNVTISWDGGSTWATNQTATNKSADDDAIEWLDFTSATAWNASKLWDPNLRVRVGTDFGGARLDVVTVRATYNDVLEVTNLRIEDGTGQSMAGGLLDPAEAYQFLFHVIDEDGWVDIGTDGSVGLRMWYDGNVTPEISFAEQMNGSDYRIEVRYEDTADPGNATLDEWSVAEGSATFNASTSSLTPIFNGTVLIGYEFNLSVSLGLFVNAASEPTNSTPGTYNDPDSWNVEVLAFDGSVSDRQPRAAGGEHMEFGVFALALMGYAAAASPSTLPPGNTTVFRVDFDNTGQGQASRVWVNVTFPVELTYVSDDAAAIGGVRTCCESFEFTDVDPGSYVFNVTASANGGVPNGTVAVTNITYQALDTMGRPINQTGEDVSVTIESAVITWAVSAFPTILQPGDTTVFRVDFTNLGQADAGNLWINVTLPAELTYLSDDAAAIGGVLSGAYDFAFANVAPGSYTFNLTVTAVGGVPNGTVALTRFAIEATDLAGAPLIGESQDVAVTLANAVLTLVVTASSGSGEPGDAFTFTATVTNSGPASAESLTIEGSVDVNATYVFSSPAGTYLTLSRLVQWNLASLAPGTQATFQWTVTVNPNVRDGATVTARATLESLDTSGTSLPSLEDSIQVDVIAASFAPALLLTPLAAERGDEVLASLYYNNTGAGTSGTVWINWTLNGHYELVALIPQPFFTTTADGFDVVLPGVASGPHRLDARLRVIRGLQDNLAMTLDVSFVSTHSNGNPLDAADLQASTSLLAPSMALTLVTQASAVSTGAAFTLDVTITNAGQAAAMGWLNLTLPAGVAFRGDDGTFAVTDTADGVSWILPSVPAGAAINLVVTLSADSGLGLESFRFAMAFTDGKGSPPASTISNAVSLQIGPQAPAALLWLWLLLAALVGGLVLFLLMRRLRRPSIEEVLVVHESGLLIAHRSKTLTPDKDEDILAAMLSTVQTFVQDAFTEHEDTPVRGLQFGEFNILVERGSHHYVAVVFRGADQGSLQARLHELSQRIEEEFGEILARWQGDSKQIRPMNGLLPLLWGKRRIRRADPTRPRERVEVVNETSEDDPGETAEAPPEEAASDHPSGPDLEETGEEVPPIEAKPEITESGVHQARKAQLQAWCLELGLDSTGPVADLRERLLREIG